MPAGTSPPAHAPSASIAGRTRTTAARCRWRV